MMLHLLLSDPGNCTKILISRGNSNWRGFNIEAARTSSSIAVSGFSGSLGFESGLAAIAADFAAATAAAAARSVVLVSLDTDNRELLRLRKFRILAATKTPPVAAATSASISLIVAAVAAADDGVAGRESTSATEDRSTESDLAAAGTTGVAAVDAVERQL